MLDEICVRIEDPPEDAEEDVRLRVVYTFPDAEQAHRAREDTGVPGQGRKIRSPPIDLPRDTFGLLAVAMVRTAAKFFEDDDGGSGFRVDDVLY